MICKQCNKEFDPTGNNQKNCSKKCSEESHKKYRKKYYKSDKAKEARAKYYKSDKGKKTFKKYLESDVYKKYNESDERKKQKKQYLQSDQGKLVHKKHLKTDKGKESQKRYRISTKGVAKDKRTYEKRKNAGLIREYSRKYLSDRKKSDPIFKLTTNVRSSISNFLRIHNMKKTNRTFKIVGCTPNFLKEYLEKQFKPGMTWKNHTIDGWHIDHIIPLSSAKTSKDVEKLMHYTNLQPMWAIENIKKSDKIIL